MQSKRDTTTPYPRDICRVSRAANSKPFYIFFGTTFSPIFPLFTQITPILTITTITPENASREPPINTPEPYIPAPETATEIAPRVTPEPGSSSSLAKRRRSVAPRPSLLPIPKKPLIHESSSSESENMSTRKPPSVRTSGATRTRATTRSRSTSPATSREHNLKQSIPMPTWYDITSSMGFDPIASLQKRLEEQAADTAQRFKLQNEQLIQFNTRLESLLQENASLKDELKIAHAEIEELKQQNAQLINQQQQHPKSYPITTNAESEEMNVEESLLGQGPEGTLASIHAHPYTPPKLGPPKQSFAQIASKKVSYPKPSRSKPRTRAHSKPHTSTTISPATMEWVKRGFQDDQNECKGYSFVYLKNQRRTKHSEVRRRLRLLGVPQARIIDIQFPGKGVVGLLIHSSFEKELLALLEKAEITTLKEYNPTAASVINDPNLTDLPDTEKAIHAKEVYQKRMLRMCLHLPQAHLGFSILRFFNQTTNMHHIDDNNLEIFKRRRPAPAIQRKQRSKDDEELFALSKTHQFTDVDIHDTEDQTMEG